ncbi:MAG TPA: hypothetical protein VI895_13465 [Bdellovibrionota bacterium]|nr:hypothetical protein [Bdellovibrionota bacterium]
MEKFLQLLGPCNIDPEDLADLRRALLLCEREKTRTRGRRCLERLAERGIPALRPLAQAGLASSSFWGGDLRGTLYWARLAVAQYPMSPAAVWCSTLLISVYRTLGMRRERFDAEQERFRIMRKIAFQSTLAGDRIYALSELMKELQARELHADAERCAEELRDLIRIARPEFSAPPL